MNSFTNHHTTPHKTEAPLAFTIHRICDAIELHMEPDAQGLRWTPVYPGAHPAGATVYFQVCRVCGGGHDLVNAVARFCPYCGAAIEAATNENQWTAIHVEKLAEIRCALEADDATREVV